MPKIKKNKAIPTKKQKVTKKKILSSVQDDGIKENSNKISNEMSNNSLNEKLNLKINNEVSSIISESKKIKKL